MARQCTASSSACRRDRCHGSESLPEGGLERGMRINGATKAVLCTRKATDGFGLCPTCESRNLVESEMIPKAIGNDTKLKANRVMEGRDGMSLARISNVSERIAYKTPDNVNIIEQQQQQQQQPQPQPPTLTTRCLRRIPRVALNS